MLARTLTTLVYLSAAELGITERERAGLIEVRDDLASGRIVHLTEASCAVIDDRRFSWGDLLFNMENYHGHTDCGTAHCIAGFLQARGVYPKDRDCISEFYSDRLTRLFNPVHLEVRWRDLTPAQAVRAIDHFLAGAGSDCWPMALQDVPAA